MGYLGRTAVGEALLLGKCCCWGSAGIGGNVIGMSATIRVAKMKGDMGGVL